MPVSCEPSDLANAAACFQCLSEKSLKEVKTLLLCAWSDKSWNLVPPDARYDITDTYTLTGLIVGATYRVEFGPNDLDMINGTETITVNGTFIAQGPSVLFDANEQSPHFIPVTAAVYLS